MTVNYESPSILELLIASEGMLCENKDWDRADVGYDDNIMEGI